MPDSVSIPDWAATIGSIELTAEERAGIEAQAIWSMQLDGMLLNEGE